MKVPYGKKFDVFLSDGTHVFMNAGSSLKYPVAFSEDKPRKVFLTGEAYFEVTHDATHSFLVETNEINVKVFGTKFNVSSYASDAATNVVLVKGSVGLSPLNKGAGDLVKLRPGFKGAFDKNKKTISTEKVDTSIYTAWMEGNLVFRNTPFKTIIKRLERQYNLVIINNNKKLAEEKFNATIETKNETLQQVLAYFDDVYHINYQIFENKVINANQGLVINN